MATRSAPERLPAFVDKAKGVVYFVVEAPAGSRNKYKYEPALSAIALDKPLPAGAVFPYDYGFVPSTRGQDGDPIDAIVVDDESTFPGCIVRARLIGVIHAQQTAKDGRVVENDRLIAVGTTSKDHAKVRSLDDLGDEVLDQIEHFFVAYHQLDGTRFEPIGRGDAAAAIKAVRKAKL